MAVRPAKNLICCNKPSLGIRILLNQVIFFCCCCCCGSSRRTRQLSHRHLPVKILQLHTSSKEKKKENSETLTGLKTLREQGPAVTESACLRVCVESPVGLSQSQSEVRGQVSLSRLSRPGGALFLLLTSVLCGSRGLAGSRAGEGVAGELLSGGCLAARRPLTGASWSRRAIVSR